MNAPRLSIVAAAGLVLLAASCGGAGEGVIDCSDYIDKNITCGILPADDQLREANVKICNNWEKTYKTAAMEALQACTGVSCDELQQCIYEANQLCVADVSAQQERLCEKITECAWEDLQTTEACMDEMARAQGLLMCLKPEILDAYVECVRSVACGPDSEDDWYGCYFAHIG